MFSLAPRPGEEEEEKGPGFSCSRMRLLPVEFHHFRILLYTCDTNIDTKRYTVHKFIIAYGYARDSLDFTHPAADLKL